jgi:hypothetical protein
MKKHTPRIVKEGSKLLDQRKHASLHWLKDPSEIKGDNRNHIRYEVSRYFRNKKREYLKAKIYELTTNSKNKNIRDLCRRRNESRSNLVKDDHSALQAHFYNILIRWRNYFSQLLNVHVVSNVRQKDIHRAELLAPDYIPFEVEIAMQS